jgi:hypothetical protein
MARSTIWITTKAFQGWTCSDCGWNSPVPTLLTTPEAKSAFDRLSLSKFREHDCAGHPERPDLPADPSVTERIRKLASRGFKPKDAIDLVLQEVQLELRDRPEAYESAKAEAQDFLRRMREGII